MLLYHRRIVTCFWLGIGLAIIHCVRGLPDLIRIGGLFGDGEDPAIESAFRYAIYKVNQEKWLLRKSKIGYDIQHLPTHNTFLSAKKACNQAGLGIAAIFGPRSHFLAEHINSMCNTLEIPHIEVRLEPSIDHSPLFSMNLYPSPSQLSRAYLELLKHFRWKKLVVIYGDQHDLLLLQDIIKAPVNTGVEIVIRQVHRSNMRETLKEVDLKGHKNYIAHLNLENTQYLLKSALQLGMIDSDHHFVLTNLDLHTLNMEDYRHNFVNLTGFRIINPEDPRAREILHQMQRYQRNSGARLLNGSYIKTEAALMYDAVFVLAHALHHVDKSTRLRMVNLSCEADQAWAYGSSLYNYLNLVEMDGLTGRITFDRGRRTDFHLDIIQLKSTGLSKIGHWSPTTLINFTEPFDIRRNTVVFANKTLIITSLLEEPYIMMRKPDEETPLRGNERFEGFCVDLIKEISQIVEFKYEIRLVPDKTYGAPTNGVWNGMVKELIDGRADLALGSFTISYLREKVIDFTKPFMNLGISILFKRPKRESPGLFSFLNPLAPEIWVYVTAAYFAVSLLMFVLARFSPYEWYNPHPCNPDSDEMENAFSLTNSFWFAVGTLMQQGSDINPRAVSTRIAGGIWWFFTLIIISSYTANLAAFLTVERMVSPIESAEDLSKQTKISYGTMAGGSTMTFFRESQIETYKRMWAFMDNKEPGVFVPGSKEGIARVKKGGYAFLMESTMLDYTVQRECELMQVGGLLDSKGYGIGTPINSPYRDPISMAILELQENGRIQMLYNKWWRNTGTCNQDDKKHDSKANELGMASVGGVFVVLMAGLALAVIIGIIEFIWNSRKNASTDRQSLWAEMAEELRFAIRCHGSTKKPALKRQCSKCVRHSSTPCTIDSPNGIIQLKDGRRSPRDHTHTETRFHYHDVPELTVEYRDSQA